MSHLKRVAYCIEGPEVEELLHQFKYNLPKMRVNFPGTIGEFKVYDEAITFDTVNHVRWYEDTLSEGYEDVKAHRAFFEFCRNSEDFGISGTWAEIGDAGYDDWEEDSFGEPTIGPEVVLVKSIEWSGI